MKAIIHWKTKDGKESGQGKPIEKTAADMAVITLNKQFSHMHHWVEPILKRVK